MRELKVVGLDIDGKRIICEEDDSSEKFILRVDDRLRAAMRGDKAGAAAAMRAHIELVRGEYELYAVSV